MQQYIDQYEREIESLRHQLAECQKERDGLVEIVTKGLDSELVAAERRIRYQDLSAAQSRIAELVKALNYCVRNVPEFNGITGIDSAISRTDNTEALEAFRDSVLEEAAVTCERLSSEEAGRLRTPSGSLGGDSGYECADAIRALKKGKK